MLMAEKEKSQLFREKSLEGIESPEALNDYLRVTTPGVWIILLAMLIFLAGALVWGIFGHIRSTSTAAVVADGSGVVCLVPEEALDGALETGKVIIDGEDYVLSPGELKPEMITEGTDVYLMLAGELKIGDVVYRVPVSGALPEGVHSGKVVKEEIRPIAFLLKE